MKFIEAFDLMKKGEKVKLPSWQGYWSWDNEKETILMNCYSSKSDIEDKSSLPEIIAIDIRETKRVEYTLQNILSDEWIIATKENTPILGGEALFGGKISGRYLMRGFSLKRKAWSSIGEALHVKLDENNKSVCNLILGDEVLFSFEYSSEYFERYDDWMFL